MWREVVQLVMALGVHQSGLSVPDRQSRWLSGPGWSIAEGGVGVSHGSSEIPDSAGSGFSPCRQAQRDHKYSLIDGGIIFGSHSEWNNPPALNCLKEVRGHLGGKTCLRWMFVIRAKTWADHLLQLVVRLCSLFTPWSNPWSSFLNWMVSGLLTERNHWLCIRS